MFEDEIRVDGWPEKEWSDPVWVEEDYDIEDQLIQLAIKLGDR